MVTHDNTCAYFIELVLKRGGRWRNNQVEAACNRAMGCSIKATPSPNTYHFSSMMEKYCPTPFALESGKVCDEYWLIAYCKRKENFERSGVPGG